MIAFTLFCVTGSGLIIALVYSGAKMRSVTFPIESPLIPLPAAESSPEATASLPNR